MKSFFYTCIFLLLAVLAQAQSTVSYVSFFPPAGVAHGHVYLTQEQGSSFVFNDLKSNTNANNYHERKGGLILGAANGSTVSIDMLKIKSAGSTLPFAIEKFEVDNIIRVVDAKGTIKNVKIGLAGGDLANVSVFNLKWPLKMQNSNSLTYNVYSSDRATMNLKILNLNGQYYPFIPQTIPTSSGGSTTRALNSSDTLSWKWLRINGTEECRLYLTVNSPSTTEKCRKPGDHNNIGQIHYYN